MKTKNPKNRHLLSLVSRGVALQVRDSQGDFIDVDGDWVLANVISGHSLNMDFREKPQETSIHGLTIPRALRDKPNHLERVYMPDLADGYIVFGWTGCATHEGLLSKKLLYENAGQATGVTYALLKLLRDANP